MLSQSELQTIQKRLESVTDEKSIEREDIATLLIEIQQRQGFVRDFSLKVNAQLAGLEADLEKLEAENARLRHTTESTFFERDACIGLIARMATALGFRAGRGQYTVNEVNGSGETVPQLQQRVVVELPSGQVSWDYLQTEAHLFESLPEYGQGFQDQSTQEIYTKVMNPGIGSELGQC